MELKIEKNLPQKVTWNFMELKGMLLARTQMVSGIVYDDSQIKIAKNDKAELNRLKKALNDERIRQEREYMIPFNEFKNQVRELCDLIDDSVKGIDKQIKDFDAKKKQEKLNEVRVIYEMTDPKPEWLMYEQIHQDKWLNASATMVSVKKDIVDRISQIFTDIESLKMIPEYSFEAIECYKQTLNVNSALMEAKRMKAIADMKAEAEKAKQEVNEIPVQESAPAAEEKQADKQEEEKRLIIFKALITRSQAVELAQYFKRNNIQYTFERG